MKAFEIAQRENFNNLSPEQQSFFSKMIMKEVKKIAKENNISEERAYWGYVHGLYGADREMGGM